MKQKILTPHGALEVFPWIIPGDPHRFPVGTVRVMTPDGYHKPNPNLDQEGLWGEYVPGEYLTIGDLTDIHVDVLVLPDGKIVGHRGGDEYYVFYSPAEGSNHSTRSLEGEDLKKVFDVVSEAADSARSESFIAAAARANAMESHFTASKKLYEMQQKLKRAEEEMERALTVGRSLGLQEHMDAQERELEKYRK